MKAVLLYLAAPLVVAVLAPYALADALELYPPIFLIGTIPVVYFFSFLVAVPMFFTLKKSNRINPILILCISFAAGAISFLLFSIAFRGSFSSVNHVVLVQDNHFTLAGWIDVIERSLRMGALSLPGGLLVWFGAKHEQRSASAAHA